MVCGAKMLIVAWPTLQERTATDGPVLIFHVLTPLLDIDAVLSIRRDPVFLQASLTVNIEINS